MTAPPRQVACLAALSVVLAACLGTPVSEPAASGGQHTITPLPATGPVVIATRFEPGESLVRKTRVVLAYTVRSSPEPGTVGSSYERELREELRETLNRRDSVPALAHLRREYRASAEHLVERNAAGKTTRDVTQDTERSKRVLSITHGDAGVGASDTAGQLGAAQLGRLVPELVTLNGLAPSEPVAVGATWDAPIELWHVLRGSTEPRRSLSGRIACRLARLVSIDGARGAEVALTASIRIEDYGTIEGAIDYRLVTTLELTGTYLHDLDGAQARHLRLDGTAALVHTPVAVRSVPLGAEALCQPLEAAGTLALQIELEPATVIEPPRPLRVERLALAALFVAAIALALIKVNATDTPWHLATARHAWATGAWPATNTFSWTHPGYPLYQQYPLYQSAIYGIWRVGGWEALSVASCAGWLAVLALWMAWGGGLRWAFPAVGAWAIALFGLRRRMELCPDIATQLLLLATVFAADAYLRGGRRSRWAALALPAIACAMANTHQLFTLGLAFQGALLVHLLAPGPFGRSARGSDDGAGPRPPAWPIALALAASLGACLLTPLGPRIFLVPIQTYGSVTIHRDDVVEFTRFWHRTGGTIAFALAAALGVAGFAIARRATRTFELALWLIGLATALVAIRGVPLFAVLSAATFVRNLDRARSSRGDTRRTLRRIPTRVGSWLRAAAALGAIAFAADAIAFRWVSSTRQLMGEEPGIGRHPACWPTRTLDLLAADPPPGRLLNVGWYAANALLLERPEIAVFVDPRFEAYPREFLTESIQAERDRHAFDALLARWRPAWMVFEVNRAEPRDRLAELVRRGGWAIVAMDGVLVVAVRRDESTRAYLARHPFPPEAIGPGEALADRPDLYGLQLIAASALARALGLTARADELLALARSTAGHVAEVRRELALAYLLVGQAALEGDPRAAVGAFDRALEIAPGSADALHGRAIARYRSKDLAGALADLDAARRADPSLDGLALDRGQVLLDLDRNGEAERELCAALDHDAANASARFLRGVARGRLGRLDEALDDLETARTARPDQWDLWVHSADVLRKQGKLDLARTHLDHAWGLTTDRTTRRKIQDLRDELDALRQADSPK